MNKRTQNLQVADEETPQAEKISLFRRIFRIKRKERPLPEIDVPRFHAYANEGLSKEQVEERVSQGLVNKTTKKYSKTYKSIFINNIYYTIIHIIQNIIFYIITGCEIN